VFPGAQPSIALLLVALVVDLVKKDEAAGTWQASHFSWRIRTVLWAGLLVRADRAAVAAVRAARLDRLGRHLHLVPVPHR
jgi:hypothetical protein